MAICCHWRVGEEKKDWGIYFRRKLLRTNRSSQVRKCVCVVFRSRANGITNFFHSFFPTPYNYPRTTKTPFPQLKQHNLQLREKLSNHPRIECCIEIRYLTVAVVGRSFVLLHHLLFLRPFLILILSISDIFQYNGAAVPSWYMLHGQRVQEQQVMTTIGLKYWFRASLVFFVAFVLIFTSHPLPRCWSSYSSIVLVDVVDARDGFDPIDCSAINRKW